MSWKKWLEFDLRRLVPGTAPDADDPPPRPFWIRWFQIQSTRYDAQDPSASYRVAARGRRWRGPWYINAVTWQQDLHVVLELLCASARTNASLADAMESAASGSMHFRGPFYGIGRWILAIVVGIAIVIGARLQLEQGEYLVALMVGIGGVVWVIVPFINISTFRLTHSKTALPFKIYYGGFMVAIVTFVSVVTLSLLVLYVSNSQIGRGQLDVLFLALLFQIAVFPLAYARIRRARLEAVFRRLCERMRGGETLSEAMARLPRFFPKHYCVLVKSGEDSGTLPTCLDGLCDDAVARLQYRQRNRPVLLYFVFLTCVCIGIYVFAQMQYQPVLSEMYLDLRTPELQLGPVAEAGFAMTAYFESLWNSPRLYTYLCIAGALIAAFPVAWNFVARGGLWNRSIAYAALAVPGIRELYRHLNTARILKVLAILLRAGVPMNTAIDAALSGDVSGPYRSAMRRIGSRVSNGTSLSEAFAAESLLFPPGCRAMIAVGEASGRLPDALLGAAIPYEQDAEKRQRILFDILIILLTFAFSGYVFFMALGYIEVSLYIFQSLSENY